MKLNNVHLTYCLNIHSGETWDDNIKAIRTYSTQVKQCISQNQPFGLGLRLSSLAADTLTDSARLDEVKAELFSLGMYAFTVNAFPHGRFHDTRIKEKVYQPDWSHAERLAYTNKTAHILATLLPDGMDGSISTVPVGYKSEAKTEAQLQTSAANLAEAAVYLARLNDSTGRTVRLALEPEPDCIIEDAESLVSYFQESLLRSGIIWLKSKHGIGKSQAEQILRSYIGACVDTCHFDVVFKDPLEAYRKIHCAGFCIPKVQLSSAISYTDKALAMQSFRHLIDGVYLHQTRIKRKDGTIVRLHDLEDNRQTEEQLTELEEARIHYHVPLYEFECHGITPTLGYTNNGFLKAAAENTCHFEIETYTAPFLKEAIGTDIVNSIVKEYKTVIELHQDKTADTVDKRIADHGINIYS